MIASLRSAMVFLSIGAALFLHAGCEPNDGAGPGVQETFLHRDSAGIAIATTNGQYARTRGIFLVDETPILEIGREDDPNYQFSRIVGLVELSNSQILVADEASSELRFYDGTGEFLYKRGGKGSGPGEFSSIGFRIVPSFRRDTLYFSDYGSSRVTAMSLDGEVYRIYSGLPMSGGAIGIVDGRVLMERSHVDFVPGGKSMHPRLTYSYLSLVNGQETIVAEFAGQSLWARYYPGQPTPSLSPTPFTVNPSAAASENGIFMAPPIGSDIIEYDISGDVRRIIRLDEPVRAITQDDIDEYLSGWADSSPLENLQFPEEMAVFESLLVDDGGWLWAKLYSNDSDESHPANWIVFDRDGRAHGMVQLPRNLQVRQIGPDFILGFELNEFWVPIVRKYRLHRT